MIPLEHHFLRTAAAAPLRLFSELDMDNNNLMNSIEKVRMLQQQWGARAAAAAAAVAGGYPGGPPGSNGPGGGPPGEHPSSLHHLLAAANSAAAAAAAASVPSLPQLYTLNPTRGSPSPLPLPAHLWSQWTALSQLPPGILGQPHPPPPHLQQGGPPPQGPPQQPHPASLGSPTGGMVSSGGNGGGPTTTSARSPINLRYSPYPSPASTKAASTSPNAGSIPPNMMNDSVGVAMGMGANRS